MYKIIKKTPVEKAISFLSDILAEELPNPFENQIPINSNQELDNFKNSLFSEIDTFLIGKEKSNIDTKYLKINEISNIISELALENKDKRQLNKIVAEKGILNTSLYKFEYKKDYDTQIGNFGIRRNHIQDAIVSPDKKEIFYFGNITNYSLYIKNLEIKDTKSYLMVIVQRINDSILIHNAWRYFTDNFSESAINILKSFVNKYGLPINIEGEESLLFYNKDIPIPESKIKSNDYSFEYKIVNPENRIFTTTTTFNIDKENNKIHIAYVFAIDNEKYLNDLKMLR